MVALEALHYRLVFSQSAERGWQQFINQPLLTPPPKKHPALLMAADVSAATEVQAESERGTTLN